MVQTLILKILLWNVQCLIFFEDMTKKENNRKLWQSKEIFYLNWGWEKILIARTFCNHEFQKEEFKTTPILPPLSQLGLEIWLFNQEGFLGFKSSEEEAKPWYEWVQGFFFVSPSIYYF